MHGNIKKRKRNPIPIDPIIVMLWLSYCILSFINIISCNQHLPHFYSVLSQSSTDFASVWSLRFRGSIFTIELRNWSLVWLCSVPWIFHAAPRNYWNGISLTSVVVVVEVVVVEVELQSPHVYGHKVWNCLAFTHIDASLSQLADPSMHACPDA